MDSLVEAKIDLYLRQRLAVEAPQCPAVLTKINELAQAAGYDVDERFASAGMAAGPEGRIASGIVDLALLGGGGQTTEYAIRSHIDEWLRKSGPNR